MNALEKVSKKELFELLEAAIDGIDGIESEEGIKGLTRYWNVSKIDRARTIIDEIKGVKTVETISLFAESGTPK